VESLQRATGLACLSRNERLKFKPCVSKAQCSVSAAVQCATKVHESMAGTIARVMNTPETLSRSALHTKHENHISPKQTNDTGMASSNPAKARGSESARCMHTVPQWCTLPRTQKQRPHTGVEHIYKRDIYSASSLRAKADRQRCGNVTCQHSRAYPGNGSRTFLILNLHLHIINGVV
jgi:hypothetical protein